MLTGNREGESRARVTNGHKERQIDYIRNHWDTLYSELLEWNTEYGSSLNSEITEAWEVAQEAAARYGDYVTALLHGISDEIERLKQQMQSSSSFGGSFGSGGASGGQGGNLTVGAEGENPGYTEEDMAHTIVSNMKALSTAWLSGDDAADHEALHKRAERYAAQLAEACGILVDFDPKNGTWRIRSDRIHPENAGKYLYDCYHTGGFVGGGPLKSNERYIKAERGELVLTANQQDSLAAQIGRIKAVADAFRGAVLAMPNYANLASSLAGASGTVNNITNTSRPVTVAMGDIIIHGDASAATVQQHRRAAEEQVNALARVLGMKW